MTALIVFFIAFAIMALAVTVQWLVYRHVYAKRVSGTLVAFEKSEKRRRGQSNTIYYPVVDFTVDDRNYHVVISDSTPRSHRITGPAEICYSPENPARCQLSYRLSARQLATSLLLVAFVAALFSCACVLAQMTAM